jgi:hypothetical protein
MTKPFRFRTIMIALTIVAGASVTGIGVGRLLTNVVLAAEKPKTARIQPRRSTPRATARALNRSPVLGADEIPGGFRVIYPNPADLLAMGIGGPVANDNSANVVAVTGLPQWTYNIVSPRDGNTYIGHMVGRDPTARGKTTTTIPVQVVPLVITITDGSGTVTYDPTANDPCITGTAGPYTNVAAVTGSPIFTSNTYVMNGVNVGNTQYIDAFQRGEFWSLVGGSNYHVVLNPTVLPAQSLTFSGAGSSGPGQNNTIGCGKTGTVYINDMDAAVRALITGPLAGVVNAGTFPIFVTKNVVQDTSTPPNLFSNTCCVLGYHGTTGAAYPNEQIYSPFAYVSSGIFGPSVTDVSILAHEMGEAIDDPTGVNPTPAWGNIGQTVGFCQGNLEVGDPLTGTNGFTILGGNGITYHMQELAFFNWFYGGTNLGAGGKYSSNGTFSGFAKNCPPGGTN